MMCTPVKDFGRAMIIHKTDTKISGFALSKAKLCWSCFLKEKQKETEEHFKSQQGRDRMRKSPEGKWQGTSVPIDRATLAIMQEYVQRTQSASLSTHR